MSDQFSIVKNSTTQGLLFNRIWLQGIVLRGVCYGIVFTLCLSCIHLLVSRQSRSSTPPKRWPLAYVCFLLLVSTIDMVLPCIENEKAYIFHPDHPGGPAAFMLGDTSAIPVIQSICFVFLQWAADGLLIWRYFAFFAVTSSYKTIIQVLLGIIAALDIGLSVMFVLCNTAFTVVSEKQQLKLILAYGIFTMLLNVGITASITMKLLRHNRFVAPLLGQDSTGYHFGIISILVESAAVLAIYNIFFIVPAAIRHPLSVIGYHIGVMVQVIPPIMIIQRVARGLAWNSEYHIPEKSGTKRSQLVFAFTEQSQRSDLESLPAPTSMPV